MSFKTAGPISPRSYWLDPVTEILKSLSLIYYGRVECIAGYHSHLRPVLELS